MNTRYYMVIIKGEIKTSEIMSCGYNRIPKMGCKIQYWKNITLMHIECGK